MKKRVIGFLSGLCFLLAALLFVLTGWYTKRFDTSFAGLLFTLTTPMKGVGGGFWADFLPAVLPSVLISAAVYLLLHILLRSEWIGKRLRLPEKAERIRRTAGKWLPALSLALLLAVCVSGFIRLHVAEYLRNVNAQTKLYEEHYTAPDTVAVTAPEQKPNVIWLVLESMETTYASREDGGIQPQNYMPLLTALARENISFSDTDKLGGIFSTNNTNWTMAALFAGTSGLPFAFPVDQNSMNKYTTFAPEITSMGDILKRDGYRQVFLCGSDGDYGGRALYFRQHGDYEIHDLFEARRRGEIPEDYYVWWGFEDRLLFRMAKDELTKLAKGDAPFNLTMLTVDAHHLGGFTCEECGTEFSDRTANVIACTDRQVGEFVDWCKEQAFWENTVLIITGDHPRMDTILTGGMEFRERRVYNSFLNARKTPQGGTKYRIAVMMDLFPTMLSAMGYRIEGDRLGLGTDLFSATPTLAEEMGNEKLNDEVQKYSQYFIDHFAK